MKFVCLRCEKVVSEKEVILKGEKFLGSGTYIQFYCKKCYFGDTNKCIREKCLYYNKEDNTCKATDKERRKHGCKFKK